MYWWLDQTDACGRPGLRRGHRPGAGRGAPADQRHAGVVVLRGRPGCHGWAGLLALRIWAEHGAARTLGRPGRHRRVSAIARRGDYAAAYRVARRVLALSEARGYVPDLSHARHVISLLQPWFEPVENGIPASQQAREGLLAGGDLAFTSYTYHQTVVGLLDCAPTLGACLAQVDAGLSFVRRTGSEQPNQWLQCYHWLADVLRREGAASEAPPADIYESNPLRSFTSISPVRSPQRSSAIRPAWPGTARRPCRCCRSPSGSPTAPWPIRCAG